MATDTASSLRNANKLASKKGRYVYGDVLGKGSFGTVLKATDTETGETVAIKILEFKWFGENVKKSAIKEVEILKQLGHENIIRIRNNFEFQKWRFIPKGMAIVTDYCSNGSLDDLLSKYVDKSSSVPKEQRLVWYKQLMSALAYIHGKSIAHRDIKPANILVDQNETLKVGDVGISKVLHTEKILQEDISTLYMQTMCGTYPFTAPEVFQNHYTIKSDIFSMGLVMYVISELPLSLVPQINQSDIVISFLEGKITGLGKYYSVCGQSCDAMETMETSESLEDERSIFNWILQARYQSRPEAAEILDRLAQVEEDRKRKLEEEMERARQIMERERRMEAAKLENERRENERRRNEAENQSNCTIL